MSPVHNGRHFVDTLNLIFFKEKICIWISLKFVRKGSINNMVLRIAEIHKYHNAPVPYPTMHHSEQKCAHFCSEWCIVGCGTVASWNLWDWSYYLKQLWPRLPTRHPASRVKIMIGYSYVNEYIYNIYITERHICKHVINIWQVIFSVVHFRRCIIIFTFCLPKNANLSDS